MLFCWIWKYIQGVLSLENILTVVVHYLLLLISEKIFFSSGLNYKGIYSSMFLWNLNIWNPKPLKCETFIQQYLFCMNLSRSLNPTKILLGPLSALVGLTLIHMLLKHVRLSKIFTLKSDVLKKVFFLFNLAVLTDTSLGIHLQWLNGWMQWFVKSPLLVWIWPGGNLRAHLKNTNFSSFLLCVLSKSFHGFIYSM